MLRLFIVINLLFLPLLACEGGYESCKQKLIDSNATIAQTIEIPIAKNQILIYSNKTPKRKIIKSDPFLGLYLVEDAIGFEYPFAINVGYPSGIAAVTKTSAEEGKIIKKQIGLTTLGEFDKNISYPSILTNSCCSLEGIMTPKGIIEKEYIERFLKVENTDYADIGIHVKDTQEGVVVTAFNPFVANNPFNEGDIILEMDDKKFDESSELMKEILFGKIGATHTLKIQRGAKVLTVSVVSQKREFLETKRSQEPAPKEYKEKKELYVDKKSVPNTIDEQAKKYGLRAGDKLLQVNGKPATKQELTKKISDFKKNDSLLFERDNFQFFVNVN